MQVSLRRLGRLVSEPESDHAQVHELPKEGHGGRVPQCVRRHCFGLERRTHAAGSGDVSGDGTLKRIGTESSTPLRSSQSTVRQRSLREAGGYQARKAAQWDRTG